MYVTWFKVAVVDCQSMKVSIPIVEMYQRLHLPHGVPTGGQGRGACLLTNNHSVTLYSTFLHIPLWVAFTLSVKVCIHCVGLCMDVNVQWYQV